MKSPYWFSIVIPAAVQLLVISTATVFPPAQIFSGQLQAARALDGAVFASLLFWPATWCLVFLSFPFAFLQWGCAKSMARDNTNRLTQFFVGSLNFALAIQLIAIALTLWWAQKWLL